MEVERLKGKHAWMQKIPDFKPITQAVIRDNGKEISFDYVYTNNNVFGVQLKSKDGIHFEGTYESANYKKGECSFDLYKNPSGYCLFGEYNSQQDGHGKWIILLENDND